MAGPTDNPPASPLRRQLTDALAEARAQRDLLAAALANQGRLVAALQRAVEATLLQGLDALPEDLPPPSEHRRRHRPGTIAKLDADLELRAFVEARLDRMTFHEIAAAVAERFPPNRRLGHSAIHRWWQIRKRRRS
jgi:hypothetical protein